MNFIRWYTAKLESNPFITKCTTSFITFGLGDLICQSFENKYRDEKDKLKSYDFKRFLMQASFGVMITPYLHFQFNVLMPRMFNQTGTLNLVKLIAYDQTINASFFIFCFFTYLDLVNGVDIKTSLHNTLIKYPSTIIANWKLWPAFQIYNFTLAPPAYRVFNANIFGLLWNVYLSYMQNVKGKELLKRKEAGNEIEKEKNRNV